MQQTSHISTGGTLVSFSSCAYYSCSNRLQLLTIFFVVLTVGTEASNNMESSKRAALMEGDKIAMSTVLLGTTTPTV